MNKLNKILAIFLALHLILGSVSPVLAEAPEASEAEEASESGDPEEPNNEAPEEGAPEVEETNEPDGSSDPYVAPEVQTQGETSNGNVGDTYISTGNADSEGNIYNLGNTNASADGGCCNSDIGVTNEGNGAGSSNTGSADISNNSTTDQTNSATIDNGLTGASITGQNSASNNVGESQIFTGNASTTGTILTAANTNVDGVAISEFNIVDDHIGDYLLDFGAGCIAGCDGFGGVLAQNLNNGANSDNDASVNLDTLNTTNQTNSGTVNNDLTLTSDTGNNTASGNTGGDSYIDTGDAEVVGNVLTFLNTNLAGNVIFGVVNIFGDLIGDIILPESALNSFACSTCGGDISLLNSGNGTNSDNNLLADQNINNTYNQMNEADINNNLILDANTGGNSASGNTGGDAYISTGDASVFAQVLNIANNNLIGGDWWLVIINRAGQWIGQIVGAPPGAFMAGSAGTEFTTNENGEIVAVNSGNGAGSDNDASVNSNTDNVINQSNTAAVNNNINLSANTGGNSTDNNTGGDNYISTGDAKVIANIVNFVNNNIIGGRLLVTFVNVFGNWTGNFITPGQEKLATANNSSNVGGGTESLSESSNNSNGSSSSSSNSSGNSGSIGGGSGGLFAGIFATSSTWTSDLGNDGDSIAVAGASYENPNVLSDSGKKKVTINLAWLVLALPILAIAILGKKVYKRGLLKKEVLN